MYDSNNLASMEFQCKRCGFKTVNKGDLKRHLMRKNDCHPILSDVPLDALLKELLESQNQRKFICDECGKKFTSSQTKYIHRKKHCKFRKTDDQIEDDKASNDEKADDSLNTLPSFQEFQDMKQRLILLESLVKNGTTTNTNNGVINNNHFHINVRNFGDENMDAIPHHFVRSCFMNLEFDTMFQNLHCDPDFPENHNVRIKSSKRALLEIYKNNRWNSVCYDKGYRELISQIHTIFVKFHKHHINEAQEDMSEEELKENEEKLACIEAWIKDTKQELQKLKEVQHIGAILDTNRCVLQK